MVFIPGTTYRTGRWPFGSSLEKIGKTCKGKTMHMSDDWSRSVVDAVNFLGNTALPRDLDPKQDFPRGVWHLRRGVRAVCVSGVPPPQPPSKEGPRCIASLGGGGSHAIHGPTPPPCLPLSWLGGGMEPLSWTPPPPPPPPKGAPWAGPTMELSIAERFGPRCHGTRGG